MLLLHRKATTRPGVVMQQGEEWTLLFPLTSNFFFFCSELSRVLVVKAHVIIYAYQSLLLICRLISDWKYQILTITNLCLFYLMSTLAYF